jgi:hypothetical protein
MYCGLKEMECENCKSGIGERMLMRYCREAKRNGSVQWHSIERLIKCPLEKKTFKPLEDRFTVKIELAITKKQKERLRLLTAHLQKPANEIIRIAMEELFNEHHI